MQNEVTMCMLGKLLHSFFLREFALLVYKSNYGITIIVRSISNQESRRKKKHGSFIVTSLSKKIKYFLEIHHKSQINDKACVK